MGSLAEKAEPRHRISLEDVPLRQVKAQLKEIEKRDFRAEIGHAVQRALSVAGRTQKEAAGMIGVDVAQVARWIAGTERPQMDRLFAIEELRQPLIVALAELAENVEVVTEIRFRKVG